MSTRVKVPHTMAARTARRRGVRGHSLLEVVIAMVLASALLIVMAQWAVGLVGAARAGSDVATFHTDAMVVASTLEADVRGAGACDATTPPVIVVNGGELRMWVSKVGQAGTGAQVVSWRLSNGLLQRTTQTVSSGCVAPASPSDAGAWTTIGANMVMPTGEGFYGFVDGSRTETSATSPAPDKIVDAVGMSFIAQSDALGVDIPVVAAGNVSNYGLAIAR